MRMTSLLRRLIAERCNRGAHGEERLTAELLNEGYLPDEVAQAVVSLEHVHPVTVVGGTMASLRLLDERERAQMTPPAQARFLRLQHKGLLDPFQADAVLGIVQHIAPRRVGLSVLNRILIHVCESGSDTIALDGRQPSRVLN